MPPASRVDPADNALARRATPAAARRMTPRAPVIEILPSDGAAESVTGNGTVGGSSGGAGTATALRTSPPSTRPVGARDPSIAAAGTLRMLPGRLEFVDGPLTGGDVRFVHSGGDAEQRVTLGRGEGPPFEHVQIASQTVSRMHAAMTYHDGRWRIANLSETNPLRVNGLELTDGDTAVPLSDGDVVELGEVVLRFRA